MKTNHWEEFLDKTPKFAIGFGDLNDGDILAPKAGYGKWSNFAQFCCLSPNLTTLYLM